MNIRRFRNRGNNESADEDASSSGAGFYAGGNGAIPCPAHKTWKDIEGRHWRASGIAAMEHARAWVHGRLDGARGLVRVEADGLVVGPYCTQVVALANQSLAAEWKSCCCDMKEFVPFLEQQQRRFDDLVGKMHATASSRSTAVQRAHETRYDSDCSVGSPTLERRMAFREAKATKGFDEQYSALASNMETMSSAGYQALADYYSREEISLHNEEAIRFECIQKVAIYVRAALSLRAGANPSGRQVLEDGTLADAGFGPILAAPGAIGNVAPCELSDEPKAQHFRSFRRYSFGLQPENH